VGQNCAYASTQHKAATKSSGLNLEEQQILVYM
jgi:hypothetical protein